MKKLLQFLYILSAGVYFTQGIETLPDSSIFFYFKETLNLSASTIMYLGALTGIAWLIKPLWGYLIDNFKFSKKAWIIGAIFLSFILSSALGLIHSPALPILIGALIMVGLSSAIRDVANDGQMCYFGKKYKITGRLQAVQWIAVTVASILTGVCGGWIAEHLSYQQAYLTLLPFYVILVLIALQYKEKVPDVEKKSLIQTLKELFTDKNLLWVSLFIFLYNFAPSIGTPLQFVQRDTFQFSKIYMGFLDTLGAGCSIIGALLYWKFSTKINIKKALIISVFIGSLTTLCYLYYTPVTAVVYNVINSVIGMAISLMLLDFMARETKRGMEATSFALLCSVSNLAASADKITGAFLFPIVGLQWLIVISALSSFACLPLIKRIKFK